MSELLQKYDVMLSNQGPVALVIKEYLLPVLGKDAPIFPPTFAPPEGDDSKPNYVIDNLGEGYGKYALIDSVGSQANRLEPLFKDARFSKLVPQVEIQIGERRVNLLDAGHRAGDAVVRFSDASDKFQKAFLSYQKNGDAELLAKVSPTSLVFGVWDSRGTQAKFPRLVSSTVRATHVAELTRNAQYMSVLEKPEAQEIDTDQKYLSSQGFSDAPAGRGPGGVLVKGEIVREAVLNLIPLRALSSADEERSMALRRYLLGLSLIAFVAPAQLFLRQGCLLTSDPDKSAEVVRVDRSGKRMAIDLSEELVLEYSNAVAEAFGVGESFTTTFLAEKAKKPKDAGKKGSK